MQIGYIHLNRTELAEQILSMRRVEQGAIDELGIGSIRDAFADAMFPGASTLHRHAKYFSLMPQVYQYVFKEACKRDSITPQEVRQMIREEEKRMTRCLTNNSPHVPGITGSESLRVHNKFVKYNPTYIYNSALRTYGFLHLGDSESIESAICRSARQKRELPERMITEQTDIADDAQETSGIRTFCEFPPQLEYSYPTECTIRITPIEREYIKNHILSTPCVHHTLYAYLLEHDELTLGKTLASLDREELPSDLRKLVRCATTVSDFIYLLYLRYNFILSKGTDATIMKQWEEQYAYIQQMRSDVPSALSILNTIGNRLLQRAIDFVETAYKLVIDGNIVELEQLIIQRERKIKLNRRKIGNMHYEYSTPVHNYRLSYRWEIVKTMIEELRP